MSEPTAHTAVAAAADSPLQGTVALVTGGSKGIGRAIAAALAGQGAAVAVTGLRAARHPDERERVLAELLERTGPDRALLVELDVRDTASLPAAVERVAAELGPIDILVNNAGTNIPRPALEVTREDFDAIMDVNLTGLFFMSQAVAAQMIARGAPAGEWPFSIINVASQMGLVGAARRSVYCASKAAVVNLTRALAVEWAPRGIRVNAVAPTFIHTPLADEMLRDDQFAAWVRAGSPMGRIGSPEDVGAAVSYLCSPGARLVCGHTLAVDGGWTAW